MNLVSYTNDFISKANVFYEDKRPRVLAYVESDSDIPFWQFIMKKYSNYIFEITSNKKSISLKECIPNATGKDALMHIKNLGKNKIVCVDADFDLIIDNYHCYTLRLRNNQYIINTEYYAIENVLCNGMNIDIMLNRYGLNCSNNNQIIKRLSKSIYKLSCLYLASVYDNKKFHNKCVFDLHDFNNELSNLKLDLANIDSSIQTFEEKLDVDSVELFRKFKKKIVYVKRKLTSLRINDVDAYRIINGHSLLRLVIDNLYKEQIKYYNKNNKPNITYSIKEFEAMLYSCHTLDEKMIPDTIRKKLDLLYS